MSPDVLPVLIPSCGAALGVLFGVFAHRTGFCTMGAISDLVTFGDSRRLRMWMLAAAVAVLGAQLLHVAGSIDLGRSFYVAPRLNWLAHLVGGLLFGVGMTLASGCGSRNLVRLGGGNLKSLVVLLILGITAYATMKGILAVPRVRWLEGVHVTFPVSQDLPSLVTGIDRVWLAALLGAAIAGCALIDREFRRDHGYVVGGLVIGAVVVAGWFVTGHLGFIPEDPDTLEAVYVATNSRRLESFTFVSPVAYTLELAMLWTDASLRITFGVATLAGTLTGALLHAVLARQFHWELFASPSDFGLHALGGALMGFGGVCALGCTIGQGLSGLSTLAVGAVITLAAIAIGCIGTLRWLYARAA